MTKNAVTESAKPTKKARRARKKKKAGAPSERSLIRGALGELGLEAKPAEVVAHLLKQGHKVRPTYVSVVKTDMRKAAGKVVKKAAKRKKPRQVVPAILKGNLNKIVENCQSMARELEPEGCRLAEELLAKVGKERALQVIEVLTAKVV